MKFTDLNGKTVSEIKNKQGKVIFSYERKIEMEHGEPLIFQEGLFKNLRSEGINIEGWEFYNCDFSFCDFYWIRCDETKFINCKISNVDFRGGRFYNINFENSVIKECDFGVDNVFGHTEFQNCDFSKANVLNCNFEAVKYDESTQWPQGLHIEKFKLVKKEVSCP